MKSILGLVGLLVVLAIGYYIYSAQVRQLAGVPPAQQLNLFTIKRDLLSLAQSERLYLAANGSYGSLEQLRESGNVNPFPGENRQGYIYVAEVDGASHFRITAKPSNSVKADLPVLSIDETMRITP